MQVIVYPINLEQSVNSEKIESSQFGNLYPVNPNTEGYFVHFSAKLIFNKFSKINFVGFPIFQEKNQSTNLSGLKKDFL